MANVLIAGVAGFIGSNFAHYAAGEHPDDVLVGVDYLSPHSRLESIQPLLDAGRLSFHRADINDRTELARIYREHGIDRVVNFAAESHNDRAIVDPSPFVMSNAVGAQSLLEVSRQVAVARHVHVSTIEVYGEQAEGAPPFDARSPLNAKTPYAAAKAAGDLLVRAYMQTYTGMDICLTHCANNYGPYQFPEKLVPLAITNVLRGRKVPIYGDGLQVRDWIHVRDHCRVIDRLLRRPERFELGPGAATDPGQLPIFDISARQAVTNLEIISLVLEALGEHPSDWLEHVADRPNHDRRYLIDPSRVEQELGILPSVELASGIRETVHWYLENEAWWRPVLEAGDLEFHWDEIEVAGRGEAGKPSE